MSDLDTTSVSTPPPRSESDKPHLRDVATMIINDKRRAKEAESEAHRIFRDAPGHTANGAVPQTVNPGEETVPGVVHPGSTGVIYCSDRAMAHGFDYAPNNGWSNLGQGAPEVGHIDGAPDRPTTIEMSLDSLEYAPTTGVKGLREAVANYYNQTYRKGKVSQYTHENVCIVPGGRSGLSRVAAVVGEVYTSYQVPEYTAYDQILSSYKRLIPIPTALEPETKYRLNLKQVNKDIDTQGLAVLMASNPRNPTGQIMRGKELQDLVNLGREKHITLVLDEFYSWYIYHENEADVGKSVSSAEYVENVDNDSVVIIDGLTKNWRLPGWRVCWVVGPKNLISALSQSGSYLDGGANHPLQLAAIQLLEVERVNEEKIALQTHFKTKRDYVLERLENMGLKVENPPDSTFYIWLDLTSLPPPLNNGLSFFEKLLEYKTIVIPGIFFDINPSHRRDLFNSPCHHFVRLSFGPPHEDLERGLDAIEELLKKARGQSAEGSGNECGEGPDGDVPANAAE